MAAEVKEWALNPNALVWASLKSLLESRNMIQDGHLRILTLRACHALNLV